MVLDGWLQALIYINAKIRIIKDDILNEWSIFVNRHKTLRERNQYKEKLEIVLMHSTLGVIADADEDLDEMAKAIQDTHNFYLKEGMNTSIEYHYSDGDNL